VAGIKVEREREREREKKGQTKMYKNWSFWCIIVD
jgi:hypothetical protein